MRPEPLSAAITNPSDLRLRAPFAGREGEAYPFVDYHDWSLPPRQCHLPTPAGRVYERFPGKSPNDMARFFERTMKADPSCRFSASYLERPSGTEDGGADAIYRPLAVSVADLKSPVGFMAMKIGLPSAGRQANEDKEWVFLFVDFSLMYVRPEYRGLGFGLMLADYACASICGQMEHLSAQWGGAAMRVETTLHADFESEEGEQSFCNIFDGVALWVRRNARRIQKETKLSIAMPTPDAGY